MKTKVLFLIESLSGGGAEKVLSVILPNLDIGKFEISVCSIVDVGVHREAVRSCVANYSSAVSYEGGQVRRAVNRLKYKLVYSWLPLSWVYRLFVPKNNDVEIAFCEGFVTKLLAKSGSKAKKIAWVHTDLSANPWPLQQGIYRNKEEDRQAYRSFEKVVCVSKAVETVMQKDYGLANTAVIYNPVDIEAVCTLAMKECPVDIEPTCFNIVAVGRLVPQKGFDELIRAVGEIVRGHPNVNLFIVGEGSERLRLERMIEACDAKDHIYLTGFMTNPYALMSRANLYVCSSRAEGFSLTVAEALALGLPIISMNCLGPAELLDYRKYGDLCKDYNDLSDSLKKAVSDKEYLADLRERSEMGKARFNIEQSIVQIEDLLEAVCQGQNANVTG